MVLIKGVFLEAQSHSLLTNEYLKGRVNTRGSATALDLESVLNLTQYAKV